MDRDKKKETKLTELQLETLLAAYVTNRVDIKTWLCLQNRRWSIASAALEKKGLVERSRDGRDLYIRATKKGSRLLAVRYPLETIYKLAGCIERERKRKILLVRAHQTAELRRAMRHMLRQLSPEQYPELLTSKVPIIRELAIRQWEVEDYEVKCASN